MASSRLDNVFDYSRCDSRGCWLEHRPDLKPLRLVTRRAGWMGDRFCDEWMTRGYPLATEMD